MPPRLLLASRSPARLATLRAAGVEPLVRVSGVDEDAVLDDARAAGALEPADAVLALAQAKVRAVVGTLEAEPAPGARVALGCDSMLELDDEVLGKPADRAEATARWRAMRGRTGVLHTGHWLVDLEGRRELGATSSTAVTFADVTDEEIAAYVATGEPLEVAGAFTIDGLGGAFVERLDGDPHGVVGLSLPLVRRLLGELGVAWTSLWVVGSPQPDPAADAPEAPRTA